MLLQDSALSASSFRPISPQEMKASSPSFKPASPADMSSSPVSHSDIHAGNTAFDFRTPQFTQVKNYLQVFRE
jgi:hypothetical protein